MALAVWDEPKVESLLDAAGFDFAIVHPSWVHTLRRQMQRTLGKLEGHCYYSCMHAAAWFPDDLWYVEGYVFVRMTGESEPSWHQHAWLAPKKFNEPFAVDPVWRWDGIENRPYLGIKFDGRFVADHFNGCTGIDYSGRDLSMLSNPEIVGGQLPGFGERYAVTSKMEEWK